MNVIQEARRVHSTRYLRCYYVIRYTHS